MFTPDQVKAIRALAAMIKDDSPSKAVLEGVVEQASAPQGGLATLGMALDRLARGTKLAQEIEDNTVRAMRFKDLLSRFPGDTGTARRQRASALRYVNKLRGQPVWEPPLATERASLQGTPAQELTMFTPDHVKAIRHLAAAITGDTPSKAVLEGVVEKANAPQWSLAALCMEIDALAAGQKLAEGGQNNPAVAGQFKALLCQFPGETDAARRQRASALRYVNKLRGQPYWEPRLTQEG